VLVHLSTAQKLWFARQLRRAVRIARLGRSSSVVCRRRGVTFELDLDEGIDLSIYLFGRFERSTASAIERCLRPGAIALDLGANVGAHALFMGDAVGSSGKVYAVEPTEYAFKRLVRNVSLNPSLGDVIRPIQAYVGDGRPPPSEVYASWKLVSEPAQHPIHQGTAKSTAGARSTTLDELVKELGITRLDLIKIDVDGGEPAILAGGAETLSRLRPQILIELAPHVLEEHGASLDQLVGSLARAGYRLLDEAGRRGLPVDARELARKIPEGGSINALAVPA
jgi:FkbM family methyltransferase